MAAIRKLSPAEIACKRKSNIAARPLPLGVGLSRQSILRTISGSWSTAVKKKPPCSWIGELCDDRVGQGDGLIEPCRRTAGFVEGQQGVAQAGVVIEIGIALGLAAAPVMQQAAVVAAQMIPEEIGR